MWNAASPNALTVSLQNKQGDVIWSYCGGHDPKGLTSQTHLQDGTQQRIIDALLSALVQARCQLGGAFEVANVVPYIRPTATQVDDGVPIS